MMLFDWVEVVLVGLILSADSFSAALAMGGRPHKFRDTFKFAVTSGGSEAIVAGLGALAGAKVIARFDHVDHWISFILLGAVALHMAYEGYQEVRHGSGQDWEGPRDFHGFFKILAVSLATSIDALAVGVGLGVSEKFVLPYLASIGLWAFLATIVGMEISRRTSRKVGPIFSFVAAFILLSLAFKFLFEGL